MRVGFIYSFVCAFVDFYIQLFEFYGYLSKSSSDHKIYFTQCSLNYASNAASVGLCRQQLFSRWSSRWCCRVWITATPRLPVYLATNSTDCSQFSMLPHVSCFRHGNTSIGFLYFQSINQSINQSNYFIVRLKVQRVGQLSLPHSGITKTEKIGLKT